MRPTLEKTLWIASLAVLAWSYGYLTSDRQWFPSGVIERASKQAQLILPFTSPGYLHDQVYDRAGARTLVPEAVQPALTLISSAWSTSDDLTPGVRLIDRQGRVLHQWLVDPTEVFPEPPTQGRPLSMIGIHGSHLFPNGEMLVNLDYAGTVRMDACGNVQWRLPTGSHHSIAQAEDGSFWIPAVTPSPRTETPRHPDGPPGMVGPFYHDLILNIDENGTVLDSIHVLDILYSNGLVRHLVDEEQLNDPDPTHLNDVEPLPSSLADQYPLFEPGDLIVSLRDLDLVFVMDPSSGQVRWHASQPFIKQHDPDFIGGGWITLFDNRWDGTARGTLLGGSRILALQPHTDSVRTLFPTRHSEPFYTDYAGKSQLMGNGRMLLTESEAGRVVEVSSDGRTIWEWIVEPYDKSSIPGVTESIRVNVSRKEVAAWPCSSVPATDSAADDG